MDDERLLRIIPHVDKLLRGEAWTAAEQNEVIFFLSTNNAAYDALQRCHEASTDPLTVLLARLKLC
jgi:hypothetical protein